MQTDISNCSIFSKAGVIVTVDQESKTYACINIEISNRLQLSRYNITHRKLWDWKICLTSFLFTPWKAQSKRKKKKKKKRNHIWTQKAYAHIDTHSLNNLIQMITQKQAQPKGGKRQKIKQSDCVLCTGSIHCNLKCFFKVSLGLKSHLFNGFCPAGSQQSIFKRW